MQIFFSSRTDQRAFKSTNGKKVDNGTSAARRWGFELARKGEYSILQARTDASKSQAFTAQ